MSANRIGLKILAVDDEELNLDILREYFDAAKFSARYAHDGIEALEILKFDQDFDVIVLDRMMPKMDGMTFLDKIKQVKSCKNIPVIMQTAASAPDQITEGVKSGVYYYLSKPYSKDLILALIRSASSSYHAKKDALEQIRQLGKAMQLVVSAKFTFRTTDDARIISALIGSSLPQPDQMIVGLTEITVNAIEHGNLGITYEEKLHLKASQLWEAEIQKRSLLPQYKDKVASIEINKSDDTIEIIVEDQGNGFEWQKFVEFDPKRLTDPSGRGIMMLMNSGFESVEYIGSGNKVRCVVKG